MDAYHISGTNFYLRKNNFDFGTSEPLGLLLVWEEPKYDENYVIGVDTSEGLGQDRSAIEVNRVGTLKRPDELVAEWVGNINGIDLAPILFSIGKLYSVNGAEPIMAIEQNRGDVVQMELRMRYGWSSLYQYKIYDRAKKAWANRLGWHTNPDTRPKMLQRAINHIRNNKWHINSPWMVDEISNFEYDPEKMKMKAAIGTHDDRVMAGFIALYCSRDWDQYDPEVSPVDKKTEQDRSKNYQTMDISVEEIENDFSGMLYY